MPSLRLIYDRLFRTWGPQGWWPARSPFEMMVGAILTQATSWHNVERAIENLRRAGALQPKNMLALRTSRLRRLIRPAGFFRQKTRRLKAFSDWYVRRYRGSPAQMFRTPWRVLRGELLSLYGIGPETADAILLYAGGQPVFVVDAYTARVFRRHRLIGARAGYAEIQQVAMRQLPRDTALYNAYHALLVEVGKRHCHRTAPDCTHCPLGDLPHTLR